MVESGHGSGGSFPEVKGEMSITPGLSFVRIIKTAEEISLDVSWDGTRLTYPESLDETLTCMYSRCVSAGHSHGERAKP